MAERTTQSWTTVPHFFVTREVDATALDHARGALLQGIEKSHGVRPTHTDVLVALVARALAKHPRVNGTWTGTGIRLNPEINVAVAMAVDDGVVTAVIRNAAKLGVGEIAVQRRDLTERARANRLRPEDITGATFTISNLGMHHVDSFTAIIVQPQAGILAVSAIKDRVVARRWAPCRASDHVADAFLRSSRGRWRPRRCVHARPRRHAARTPAGAALEAEAEEAEEANEVEEEISSTLTARP